jgi:hypothetical protein
MIRRVTFALVVSVALLGTLILPTAAPPASAAVGGNCSVVVPTTVSITRPYTLMSAKLGSDCAASGMQYAWWQVRHSYYGPSDWLGFDSSHSAITTGFYDWERVGTYYVEPDWAVNTNSDDLMQNSRSYVVKWGSRIAVSTTRAGSYVTVNVAASYYSPVAQAFTPWGKDKVVIQYRTPGSSTWRYMTTKYTASNGKTSYRVYAPKSRYYRAGSYATSAVWGQSSAAVTR